MTVNSSANLPQLALAPHFTEKAAKFLTEFANTHPDGLYRLEQTWGDSLGGKAWNEAVQNMAEAQQTVREVWEGKYPGDHIVNVGLGLSVPRRDYRREYDAGYIDSSMVLFHVSWEYGCIWASPRDLNDYVWLSLLQNSKRLAVCGNKDCLTPYFIRSRPNRKFCSDECALPAQKAFKRHWWAEHGEQWREKRAKRSRNERSRKRPTKRRN